MRHPAENAFTGKVRKVSLWSGCAEPFILNEVGAERQTPLSVVRVQNQGGTTKVLPSSLYWGMKAFYFSGSSLEKGCYR